MENHSNFFKLMVRLHICLIVRYFLIEYSLFSFLNSCTFYQRYLLFVFASIEIIFILCNLSFIKIHIFLSFVELFSFIKYIVYKNNVALSLCNLLHVKLFKLIFFFFFQRKMVFVFSCKSILKFTKNTHKNIKKNLITWTIRNESF